MAPTVQPANGLDNWILKSRLPYYDLQGGDYFEEIWSGLYSTVDSQVDVLKGRGATSVRPSKGGAVCELTATFPGKNEDEPGGGGANNLYLSENWDCEVEIVENSLRALPTWGPAIGMSAEDKMTRANALVKIDARVDAGIPDTITFLESQAKYYQLKAFGVRGYLRAAKTLVRTLTYARGQDAAEAVSSANDFTVVTFANIPNKPDWLPEPQYEDVDKDGKWTLSPFQWLTMPATWGASMSRTFTVRQSWRGSLVWPSALYKNGGAII